MSVNSPPPPSTLGPALQFRPPRWLRNPHLQSVLGMSSRRRRRGQQAMARMGTVTAEHYINAGEGITLHGLHSTVPAVSHRRGLVILLHGWEGSADSSYMLMTTASLLAAGFDVFRLHFRDHGNTHHLNPDVFHPVLVEEVGHAITEIARRFPHDALMLAGFSLGGNFALRAARHASRHGTSIQHVAVVCPALDICAATYALERGRPYHWWFRRRWAASLTRKRELFPDLVDVDDQTLRRGVVAIINWLVDRYTDVSTIEQYFDKSRVSAEDLATFPIPVSILTAADDPMIPLEDFHRVQAALPSNVTLEITRWGGHCGFLENARLDGYAERWVSHQMRRAHGECGASRIQAGAMAEW